MINPRWLICVALLLGLTSVQALNFSAPPPKYKTVARSKQKTKKQGIARVTFYHAHEDKYGSRIACSNQRRATQGKTIAAERAFPFGTLISIPWLAKIIGTGVYVVEDRGTAVERRKASTGQYPVFDVFCKSSQMKKLARFIPEYLPYEEIYRPNGTNNKSFNDPTQSF